MIKKVPIIPIKTTEFIKRREILKENADYKKGQWIEWFEPGQRRWMEVQVVQDLGDRVVIYHPAYETNTGFPDDTPLLYVPKKDTRK
jgi:hypothetical protein